MTFETINKFKDIKIIPNSLFIIDIDDTLIKFENINFSWWINIINKYFLITKNIDQSEKLANDEWINVIKTKKPFLVDNYIYDFINKLKLNNCKIILLTARDKRLKKMTELHLSKVNLLFNDIYYNKNKGQELKKILKILNKNFDDIIIVDDRVFNLIDIKKELKDYNYNIHLYHIVS